MFNMRPNQNKPDIDNTNNNTGQILYVLAEEYENFITHAVFTTIPTAAQLQNICNALCMDVGDFHTYMGVYEIPVGSLVDSIYPSHHIINWTVI